jgi:hypothetical protein
MRAASTNTLNQHKVTQNRQVISMKMLPLRRKFALTAFCLLSGQVTLAASLVNLQDLVVDLGYDVYQGAYNSTTHLNIWKGYVKLRITRKRRL